MQNLVVPCHMLWFEHDPRRPRTTTCRQDHTSLNEDALLVKTEGIVIAIASRRLSGEGLWVFDAVEA